MAFKLLTSLSSLFGPTSPSFSCHADLFPDVYAHPGYPNGVFDDGEFRRRKNWLKAKFPQYTDEHIRSMVEAGLRAEISVGTAVTDEYQHLGIKGPHPKEYVINASVRESVKPELQDDLLNSFSSLEQKTDWSGLVIGMDTDIRSYNNAAESSNLLEMTFFQSRTLQQIADSKIDAEFARFTTFLREYVFERILQQRNNRHAAHRIALSSLLRKANQEPDAYEKITTDYAINSGDTLRRYIVSFKESDAMQASASSEDDLSEATIAQSTPSTELHSLPPHPDDPAWISLDIQPLPLAMDAVRPTTLVQVEESEVGLGLAFKFLGYPEQERRNLIKHVTLWPNQLGADSLLLMKKVKPEEYDLVDFVAWLCDMKHNREKSGDNYKQKKRE